MKIRTKISLSIGLLLAIITLLGAYAAHTTERSKRNTENILADNYNSVKYAQKMLWSIHNLETDSLLALATFSENLALQQRNISENAEDKHTAQLEKQFNTYRTAPSKANLIALSETINMIILLNGNAIEKKSEIATYTAHQALILMIVLALLCFVVAVCMLIKIPQTLTNPIEKLIEGILEISNHNYDKRLRFDEKSEFGEVASSFNNMAEELAQFQQSSMARIISTKQYLEIVINSIDEPIIGLDSEKNILFVNKTATAILNIPSDKMLKKSALDLSLSNDLLRRLVKGIDSKVDDEPLKIYTNDKESYFDVHYLALPEDSGIVIMLNNITRFKELDNAKTNFISVISHELKTPISAIMMSVKLLKDNRIGAINDEQSALAQSISENSDRLLSISSELLKMTQVEAGVLQLSPKITKPIELINYAIGATRVLAAKFECNIEVQYPETIEKLFVDSEKIAWVVTNLLSNAIHYSSDNARIIIGAKEVDNKIEVYIKDFGKGIDSRYHKTIFDRYFRVPGTKVQGSGLGLAISKDFVEAHAGTIRVESELGCGSCFIISLPKN